LAALLSALACSADDPVGPQFRPTLKNVLIDPSRVLSAAEAGTLGRGEQDFLVRIERQLPGFGGLYLSNGAVRVYMKTTAVPLEVVRDVLAKTYSTHPNAHVREVMANVGSATIIPCQFALSELIALQNQIETSLSGWNGVGTNIMANKVVVAFPDSGAMTSGLIAIEALGISAQALTPIVMPPVRATSDFYGTVRPMRAGPAMVLLNDTYEPHGWKCTSYCYPIDYGSYCTIGFNVNAGNSGNYFMTASHCANSWRGQNGAVGDSIFQLNRTLGGLLGLIVWNVYWTTGLDCPVSNVGTGEHYSFCTTADVALAQYIAGVGFERKVGTSQYGGTNGYPATNHINNRYPINSVLAPEYVDSIMHHQVHKSGGYTYTTTGSFVADMIDVSGTVCWGGTHYNPCTTLSMFWRNHTLISSDVADGDSGSPVFTGTALNNGGPYAALGILVAGAVPIGQRPGDPCPSCQYAFSRWDQIEPRLQLGTLNPQTVF
jgi:hypothetical protein